MLGVPGRIVVLAALLGLAGGQVLSARGEDPDVLFLQARKLPKDRRDQARELLRQALAGHPDYDEVRIHLARLYAWDDRYDEARQELRYVLERRPDTLEAREAAIDVEVWSDHPQEALRLCNDGLALKPGGAVLLYRKARVLRSLKDIGGAYAAVQAALALDPDLQPARVLRDDLKELLVRSKVALTLTRESFSETFDPWNMAAVTVGHRFDFGTVNARVTRAERFGDRGTQAELEAYPHLFDGTYAYVNLGKSSASMFPGTSAGGELYHNFKGGFEGSLGFRYLAFGGSPVTVYTGSLGRYVGNALYGLRLNHTPSATGSSLSGSLSGRWYLEDADSYGYLTMGTGLSPTAIPWSAQAVKLRSRNVSAGGQKRLGRAWILSAGAAWERQEYYPSRFQHHLTFTGGLEMRF